jgi:hypothetical protein
MCAYRNWVVIVETGKEVGPYLCVSELGSYCGDRLRSESICVRIGIE